VFTVDPPQHLGTLYNAQLREEEHAARKIRVITKQQPQQPYNPKQQPQRQQQQQARLKIVNDPSTYIVNSLTCVIIIFTNQSS
jgi:hypothetical protein